MKKKCRECNVEKPLFQFYRNKQGLDGHHNVCKECAKAKAKITSRSKVKEVKDFLKMYIG